MAGLVKKKGNRASMGAGRFDTICTAVCDFCDSSTACRVCRLEPVHILYVGVIDLPLLRVAVEGSDNPISLEKPCQASLPPDQ